MKSKIFLPTIILVTIGTGSMAQIIHVPGEQPTIQAGIDVSQNGDTVLVQPGTYLENISFNGKGITVASLFLIEGDTSYISQTIIDGYQGWDVVTFDYRDSLSAVLCGFTITNGTRGIYCGALSNPLIKNVIIKHNIGHGGIYIGWQSATVMENVIIEENTAYDPQIFNPGAGDYVGYGRGGGVYCGQDAVPTLINVLIENNIANGFYGGFGGGMYLSAPCGPVMKNVTITDNIAAGDGYGGGICYRYVFRRDSLLPNTPDYEKINDTENPVFDSLSLCNIYLNRAAQGNDLYFWNAYIENILLDTFTVMSPTEFHVSPVDSASFNILNAKLVQVNADLFVSPSGSDDNSGVSPDQPLKTLYRATAKIMADSNNPRTIHLDEGTYSPSEGGEFFPVHLQDHINLEGDSEHGTIFNAENASGVIYIIDNQYNHISNLTVTGGWKPEGGGIYCYNADPVLENLTITGNQTQKDGVFQGHGGGGLYLCGSAPVLKNLSIHDNSAFWGGGIYFGGIPEFDSIDRCDIYSNFAMKGNDLYAEYSALPIKVIVDTFSVLNPNEFHANKLSIFSFDILHGYYEQRDADLYISPDGDNSNSGLSADDPLQTIHCAQSIILADSLDPHTLYLQNGTYSPSFTGEFFPVNLSDFIHLQGTSPQQVILDAESTSNKGIQIDDNHSNHISGMTITGTVGGFTSEAGISCYYSNPNLENLEIYNNPIGIYLSHSGASIRNVSVVDNSRGIYCGYSSNPIFENVSVKGNHGVGLVLSENSSPALKNVLIADNESDGVVMIGSSSPAFINNTISGNHGNGINITSSSNHPELINTIVWGNLTNEIILECINTSSSITVSYSDIPGGESGIVNDSNCTVNWLDGNIDMDPLFFNSGDHPYQINSDSPCIDAGIPDTSGLDLPSTDILGNPRIWNNRIDMGAYEWNAVGIYDDSFLHKDLMIINSPNPVTHQTTFYYNLEESCRVVLYIYDNCGKIIDIPLNTFQVMGKHTLVWYTDRIPAGLYHYRLIAKEKSGSGKLVVIN